MSRARETLLVTALLLAACSPEVPAPAPQEQPGCATDADCPQGKLCDAGSCLTPAGPPPSECTTSDDCLEEPLLGIPEVYWDGEGAVCTVDPEGCTADGCVASRVCLAPADAATRPGEIGCGSDAQCGSGRCVEHDGDRVCFKSCAGDDDCAGELSGGNRVGDSCARVDVAGASLLSCVPAVAGRTLCRNDCDCTGTDDCGPLDATAPRCRFASQGSLLPGCEPIPAGATRTGLARCNGGELCESGRCLDPCNGSLATGAKHFCFETQDRCSQPCGGDGDCPQRTQCLEAQPWMRVGAWMLEGQKPTEPGRDLLYCQLPLFGCFDERDCYPSDDGLILTWEVEQPRCQVQILRPSTAPRIVTICKTHDPALVLPGDCCERHEDCDSGICVPTADGCAVGRCTVPCDPDPEEEPGVVTSSDRCGQFSGDPTGLSHWFDDKSCQELLYERELVKADGTTWQFSTPLRVCR